MTGRRLPPLNSLRAFEAAARHGSFTGAARELGVTQSAVSRHVLQLEASGGGVLCARTRRGIELTVEGAAYAAAFNDLAIAYEHEGMLEKARKAYEKAAELDPNNAEIRQNFELFKEINDRSGSSKEKE